MSSEQVLVMSLQEQVTFQVSKF